MKFNKWTVGLAAVGVVSLTSAAYADESKMNKVDTALSNVTLSGYVDVAGQFNPGGGGDFNGMSAPNYTFGNKGNSINLNVIDIALDKPQDESPWASGYHVELWIGPDGQALGVGNDIRQAYIMLRTPVGNGIDWKIGVFDTIIGYESTTSGNNPNYSHSYGYNLEPTTHTGVLASYKATDWIQMQVGVADTSYAGGGAYTASANNGLYLPTFMWGPTLTAPDSFGWAKGATLSLGTINTSGNTGQLNGSNANTGNGNGATSYYAGFTLPTPVAALKVGGSFDYLNARDVSVNTWDLAGYSTFQFNDKLSFNLRAEYMNAGGNTDRKGQIGGSPFASPVSVNGGAFLQGPGFAGTTQQAQEITATIQYALWANVLTRIEFRWDHVNHGEGYVSHDGNTPDQNAYMLAAQAIYTF